MEEPTAISFAPRQAYSRGGRGQSRHRADAIFFARAEFLAILNVYGRMVAAGEWRDYSLDVEPGGISFSAYRRASEAPDYRIVKNPALTHRQGAYALLGRGGQVLKRGHDLKRILAVIEKKLLKLVD